MAEQPTQFPRWADDPPVAPPTTIVEPSEPEKDEGFQPGVQALVVAYTIDNVLNSHTYDIRINGVLHTYLSDGTATLTEILNGLRDSVNAGSEPVTAVNTGTEVEVTADVAGQSFVYDTTDTANMSVALVTPNKSNKPIRQYLNWLFNLAYQWFAFLLQSLFRSDDMFADQALAAHDDPPSTGVGLGITAGDFSGRVYVNGHAVGPTESPAHTYGASSDTYWDLDEAGAWHASAVANGAGAPAVFADSVRVYMVETDGVDRVDVTSFVEDFVRFNQQLDFEQPTRFGDALLGSAANRAIAARVTRFKDGGPTTYRFVEQFIDDGGADLTISMYIREETKALVVVRAATWDGTQWTSNAGAVDVEMLELSTNGARNRVLTTGPSVNFADSVWFAAETSGGTLSKLTLLDGRIKVGTGLTSNYESVRVARFDGSASATIRSLMSKFGSHFRTYALDGNAIGTDSTGRGGEIVSNCYFDESDSKWKLQTTTEDAFKIDIGRKGIFFFRHDKDAGTTWDDAYTSGNWGLDFVLGGETDQLSMDSSRNLLTPAGYKYKNTQTRTVTVSAMLGASSHTGASGGPVGDEPFTLSGFFAYHDLITNVRCMKKVSNIDAKLYIPIDQAIPHGAIITEAHLHTSTEDSVDSTDEVTVYIARVAHTGLINTLASTQQVTPDGEVDVFDFTINLDGAESVRTLDKANYSYVCVVDGADDSDPQVVAVEITYTLTEVRD